MCVGQLELAVDGMVEAPYRQDWRLVNAGSGFPDSICTSRVPLNIRYQDVA